MLTRIVPIVCAGALLFIAGCASDNNVTPGGIRILTDASLRKHDIMLGKRFVIALRSNPTTGYTWSIVKPGEDTIIRFVASQYRQDKVEAGRTGAGGDRSVYVRSDRRRHHVRDVRVCAGVGKGCRTRRNQDVPHRGAVNEPF